MPSTRTKKAAKADAAPKLAAEIGAIKGFGMDWKCRDFQFEVGKTYEHEGKVLACNSGFHAIEGNPLEVFDYYAPGISRYAEVRLSGDLSRHSQDSKVAAARIAIVAEITIPDLVARAVKWIADRCTPADAQHVGGDRSAASSTGDQSAASSTGDRSAASSTGDRSAASSTGDQSAAMASGKEGRVMGAKGCALFLVYRNPSTWEIEHVWAGIAGRNGIKPLTWYRLGADGKPVEAA